ncbi:DUF1631 domain-containing protein [Alkalimarinus alittae]|uniref:DUF1631 domain-containing protein n=1 Tax=Alkalimarinus alittae TaxID=2961619 RepID=A0ABY6MYT9_9ALTE|nr:DUF1631 domain-containing protein [Alkalimarinus alittae]UZE94994.1 DUF1631 domain-containing protein [Alkalimarinus alittae]
MTQNHNVVDLDKLRTVPDGKASSGSLPAPLSKVRDLAIGQLKTLLRQLFDNADDALFELADKAGSNGEQAKYFDAMREVRLQRKQIALLMLQSVVRSFNQVGRYKLQGITATEAPSSLESLSLVQNDELEERVAIEGMVSKTRGTCGQSIDHYQIRVESLLPNASLDQAHIPASPEILVHSFVDGCKDLQVDIESKLIVFKLFEKYVLTNIADMYQKSNQQLIDDGVMPDLKQVRSADKRVPGQSASAGHSTSRQSSSDGNAYSDGSSYTDRYSHSGNHLMDGETGEIIEEDAGLFESLRHMLHAQGNAQQTNNGFVGGSVGGASGFTEVSRDQVVSVLSNAQQGLPLAPNNGEIGVMDFRSLLIGQMSESGIEAPKFKKVDDDVINLVSMLFEFILDDRQLQPTMKALIARLQIPMLKVAMLDRNFFNKGGHPARKLLNEIATAAIGWNEKPEGQRDPLKDKVEYVVQSLLENFDSNFDVFESLLSEFTRFLDVESRRGQLIEQRTRDAEEGMARNETAKSVVQHSIERIVGNKTLPESAKALLQDAWGQYMSLTYLKHGEQSAEWGGVLTVAENLVWSVCPDKAKPDARNHLLSLIPGLLKNLRAGLNEASYDQFKSSELLKSLEGLHIDALQMLATASLDIDTLKAENAPHANQTFADLIDPKTVEKDLGIDDDLEERNEGLSLEDDSSDISNSMDSLLDDVDLILDGVSDSDISGEGVAVNETEAVREQTICEETIRKEPKSAELPEAITIESAINIPEVVKRNTSVISDAASAEMIESLRVGSWLEFQENGKIIRCKLAALIRVTGKYIFVDRSGIKVADKNKPELLDMAQQGLISVLNDGLLFDRALESVIGNLRNNRKD